MSPLLAPPDRGYADEQRIVNWDSGVLWSKEPVAGTATITSPLMDVGRHGYLGGLMQNQSANPCLVTVAWYADSAATVLVGRRTFAMSDNVANAAQIRLPNLGSFCQVTVTNIGGASFTFLATVIGTNRTHPCEFIPVNPGSYSVSAALVSGGQLQVYVQDYISGAAAFWVSSAVAQAAAQLGHISENGSLIVIAGIRTMSVNADVVASVVVPPGPATITVFNLSAGAATVTAALVPSLTGAT